MDLYREAHNMGEPNDAQSSGQGQPPAGPVALLLIGALLLGLAVWAFWSAINGGDFAHWVVLVLLLAGGTASLIGAGRAIRERRT